MTFGKTSFALCALTVGVLILGGCETRPPAPEPQPVVERPIEIVPPVQTVMLPPEPAPIIVPELPPVPRDPYGTILSGVLDLPRSHDTAAIDGCTKVHKGLTMSGGFLFFTCEKLLPGVDISRQFENARNYENALMARGWDRKYNAEKEHDEFVQYDGNGCKMTVSVRPWTDRSLNEKRGASRDSFRQIVFLTNFAKGQACEPTYQAFKRGTLFAER